MFICAVTFYVVDNENIMVDNFRRDLPQWKITFYYYPDMLGALHLRTTIKTAEYLFSKQKRLELIYSACGWDLALDYVLIKRCFSGSNLKTNDTTINNVDEIT